MINENEYRVLLELTASGLSQSADEFMSQHDYSAYQRWAFSPSNAQLDRWLKITGVIQSVHLTMTILRPLLSETEWERLLPYTVYMNIYMGYEVVSDNLGIGVAYSTDLTVQQRLSVLFDFNEAMVARLAGNHDLAVQVLNSLEQRAKNISTFEQSLAPDKHRAIAQLYAAQFSEAVIANLEYALMPLLISNVESCYKLATITDTLQIGPIVRESLSKRYIAVNELIRETPDTLDQLLTLSADAILVVPILAYYLGVLCEIINVQTTFYVVVDDGSLKSALYHAALLVRLLNDMGALVVCSTEECEGLVKSLSECAIDTGFTTLNELIVGIGDRFGAIWTRIQKDAQFGEFNLVLNGLGCLVPNSKTFSELQHRLEHLCVTYTTHQKSLEEDLGYIESTMGNNIASSIVRYFVQFHERMYLNLYTTSAGEYTVG